MWLAALKPAASSSLCQLSRKRNVAGISYWPSAGSSMAKIIISSL